MSLWSNRLWLRLFPELKCFKTENERLNVFMDAIELPPAYRGSRFVMMAFIALVAFVASKYLLPSGPPLLQDALMVPLFVLGLVFPCLYYRHVIRKSLRERLARKGFPICIKCGYQLRGLTEPRCPECGKPFDPKLLGKVPRESDYE